MAVATENKQGIVARMRTFFEEVGFELKKVTWPTMDDLKVSTKVTLFLLGIMAVIVLFYDKIFEFVVLRLLDWAGG